MGHVAGWGAKGPPRATLCNPRWCQRPPGLGGLRARQKDQRIKKGATRAPFLCIFATHTLR